MTRIISTHTTTVAHLDVKFHVSSDQAARRIEQQVLILIGKANVIDPVEADQPDDGHDPDGSLDIDGWIDGDETDDERPVHMVRCNHKGHTVRLHPLDEACILPRVSR